jgi:hypothetical protein
MAAAGLKLNADIEPLGDIKPARRVKVILSNVTLSDALGTVQLVTVPLCTIEVTCDAKCCDGTIKHRMKVFRQGDARNKYTPSTGSTDDCVREISRGWRLPLDSYTMDMDGFAVGGTCRANYVAKYTLAVNIVLTLDDGRTVTWRGASNEFEVKNWNKKVERVPLPDDIAATIAEFKEKHAELMASFIERITVLLDAEQRKGAVPQVPPQQPLIFHTQPPRPPLMPHTQPLRLPIQPRAVYMERVHPIRVDDDRHDSDLVTTLATMATFSKPGSTASTLPATQKRRGEDDDVENVTQPPTAKRKKMVWIEVDEDEP